MKPESISNADSMLKNMLIDHEAIIKTLRKHVDECQQLKDEGTANFITNQSEEHEKMASMIRIFLPTR